MKFPRVTFQRGIVGDASAGGAALFGHYRFDADAPKYTWSLEPGNADLLLAWGEHVLSKVQALLRRDAARLDAPLGLLADNANHELWGRGARDFDDDGVPLWSEAEPMHLWTMSRTYSLAVEELVDRLRSVGENTIGLTLLRAGLHPKPGETKPLFLKVQHLMFRVNTASFQELGSVARDFFAGHERRRRRLRVERAAETIRRKRRSAAAKLGWKRRRRAAVVEVALGRLTARERKRAADLMYRFLLRLIDESEAKRDARRRAWRKVARGGGRGAARRPAHEAPKHPRGRGR